jgi:hypothetical protein
MVKFLLWVILLVIAWPLAILVLILYPVIWVLSIPFRLLGVTVKSAIELVGSILRAPARLTGR